MSGSTTHHNENIVTIAGRVEGTDGTADITAGTGFYVTERGTGLYGITFPRAGYEKVLGFTATAETTDHVLCFDVTAISDSTVDVTSGSTAATADSTTLFVPGMSISGTGIPSGSWIAAKTSGSTTAFTLSHAATASGTNITAAVGVLTEGSDGGAVCCVRTEELDDSVALRDADFSFVAVLQVADGNS